MVEVASSQKAIEEALRLRQAVFISGDALAITFQTFVTSMQSDGLVLANYIRPKYFTADERVIVEILNPFDGETRISKSVMDMSATGLSLRTTFESQLFRPDTYLPTMRVLVDGELYKKGSGRVVYRRKLMDLNGQIRSQVGIKFES